MKNKNFIIFSSIDWNTQKQLHHQLTESLISKNNKVLFIENTGVRRIKIKDYKRIFIKFKNWINTTGGYKEQNNLITILVTIIFPFPYSRFFNFINSLILRSKIGNWLKYNNGETVIITFLPTPLIHSVINKINHDMLIYYCANNMSQGSKEAIYLQYWENLMFSKCDYVISISDAISLRAKQFNEKIYKISPGVDDIFFNKNFDIKTSLLPEVNNQIIGYVGAISNAIDFDLLEYLTSNLKNLTFVFIGPIIEKFKFKKIQERDNVLCLGELKHKSLPPYILKFDIAIVPYKVNDFTNSVYSCKLNEYLACGRTIISTPIKEHKKFSYINENIVFISNSKDDFKNKIIANLNNYQNKITQRRIEIAKQNSWVNRFNHFEKVFEDEFNKTLISKKVLKYSFIELYKKSRRMIYYSIGIIAAFYLIIFYSPLFYLIGNKLNSYTSIEVSDAVVVYSGNDARFSEQSYLQRTLEAKYIFDKGYTQNIILISGKEQKIKEVSIMKSYLIENGLSLKDIHIFDKYPTNTYLGIKMISQHLKENKFKKIIYLTSDYHNMRSKLIWNSNYPNYEIITPNLKLNKKMKIYWASDLNKISLIIYEILAIFHNKINNRF